MTGNPCVVQDDTADSGNGHLRLVAEIATDGVRKDAQQANMFDLDKGNMNGWSRRRSPSAHNLPWRSPKSTFPVANISRVYVPPPDGKKKADNSHPQEPQFTAVALTIVVSKKD